MSIISIKFDSEYYTSIIYNIDDTKTDIVPKNIEKYKVENDKIDYYYSQLSFINDCLKENDSEKKIILINDIYLVNLFNEWIKEFLVNRMFIPYKTNYRPNVELLLNIYKKIQNSKIYYRNNPQEYLSEEYNNENWLKFLEVEKNILYI
jgi:hypothetical protein